MGPVGNIKTLKLLIIPVSLFLIGFFLLPFSQMSHLTAIPGDVGDARLNNYFLENVYQFFSGHSDSLWHLGFFWPFPYVLGFSDNLFGAAPVYMLARWLTGESDTAFQIWFLVGYAANFGAAYYALRRLGASPLASSIGALIFTFALSTTAHSGHAQLHYRFGVPLATAFFVLFLEQKRYRLLAISGAWLTWQFYCGVYIGFFTLLLLAVSVPVHFASNRYFFKTSFSQTAKDFFSPWSEQSQQEQWIVALSLAAILFAIALLFYPYFKVSQLYGARRDWAEISRMLPRVQSYFLADSSYFWGSASRKLLRTIPLRHEHQMFMGAVPMLLAIFGFMVGSREKNGQAFVLVSGMLGLTIVLTLYVGGYSLWYFLHRLPLASAIRAMTRLDIVLLFPAAYLAAVAIDRLDSRRQYLQMSCVALVLLMLIVEFSSTTMSLSPKQLWRDRFAAKESQFPQQIDGDAVPFFAQQSGPFYADELDAMWVALKHRKKTLNGYSGMPPPRFDTDFRDDCSELPKRLMSFLAFSRQEHDEEAYRLLARRIVPIGFAHCNADWFANPPKITTVQGEYSADEVRHLSYRFDSKQTVEGRSVVNMRIVNAGHQPVAALSAVGKPLLMSWRFLDAAGTPSSGWNTRKDLPFDIPADGELIMQIPIDPNLEVKGGVLQISMVQEFVFWAHDVGVKPLDIPWN